MDTHIATTVAYLLDTSIDRAQTIVNAFRDLDCLDSSTLAAVVDLIMTTLHHAPLGDDMTETTTISVATLEHELDSTVQPTALGSVV